MARCPITGDVEDRCDCGSHDLEDDEQGRPELTPKFTAPDCPEDAA